MSSEGHEQPKGWEAFSVFVVLYVLLLGVLWFYAPKVEQELMDILRGQPMPELTFRIFELSRWLRGNLLISGAALVVPLGGLFVFMQSERGIMKPALFWLLALAVLMLGILVAYGVRLPYLSITHGLTP